MKRYSDVKAIVPFAFDCVECFLFVFYFGVENIVFAFKHWFGLNLLENLSNFFGGWKWLGKKFQWIWVIKKILMWICHNFFPTTETFFLCEFVQKKIRNIFSMWICHNFSPPTTETIFSMWVYVWICHKKKFFPPQKHFFTLNSISAEYPVFLHIICTGPTNSIINVPNKNPFAWALGNVISYSSSKGVTYNVAHPSIAVTSRYFFLYLKY